MRQKQKENETRKRKLTTELEESKRGKEETSEREALLKAHATATEEKQALAVELLRYSDCDPEVIKLKQNESNVAKDAANRWTGKRRLKISAILLQCHSLQ